MKNRKGRRSRNKAAACNEPASDIGSGSDRLTNLPNDVLLNILERLDTLHAVRTCILSKQMLRLPTMLSQLVINIGPITRHPDESGLCDLIRRNRAVANVTKKMLSARSPEISIRKLSVRFVLRIAEFLSIRRSFARAMATHKDVDAVEFDILTEKSYKNCTADDLLLFANLFNTFLCASQDVFAGLTRLRLENMMFGAKDIPNILCTCKRLESLCFSSCDSAIDSVVQLEHAQLVELEVDRGQFPTVELTCLPKLQRVHYDTQGSHDDHSLSFGFTPQLSKLSLAKTALHWHKIIKLSELFANVPSITDLHLDFKSQKIWVQPECPKLLAPVFAKLRRVNLDNLPEGCDIAWTMFILEAAPSLEELCITVWDHWCDREEQVYWQREDLEWKPSAPDHLKHKNLAKLTIHGFKPNEKLLRYVRRVMVAAVNMVEISLNVGKVCNRCKDKIEASMGEKLSLHDTKPCKRCKNKMKLSMEDDWRLCSRCMGRIKVCPLRFPRAWWEECLVRKEIRKGLRVASPAAINFIHGITLI